MKNCLLKLNHSSCVECAVGFIILLLSTSKLLYGWRAIALWLFNKRLTPANIWLSYSSFKNSSNGLLFDSVCFALLVSFNPPSFSFKLIVYLTFILHRLCVCVVCVCGVCECVPIYVSDYLDINFIPFHILLASRDLKG